MGENSRFDFCPKCGALAKDGICQSCGYQNQEIIQLLQADAAQPMPEQSMPELPTAGQSTVEQPAAAYAEEPVTEQSAEVSAEVSTEEHQPVETQPIGQDQPAAQSAGQEQQIYGQFSGQIYGQSGSPAQQTVQSQGYYMGQQAAQPQGYYMGQQAAQPQGYYTGQQTAQPQGYYTGQQTVQPQGYYTGQQTVQPQGYYTGQQAVQPQGYYTGQQTAQSQGYYTGQQTVQPQGYYTGQQTAQSQGYYTGQQTAQPQGYYAGPQSGQVQQPYGSYTPAVPPETTGGKTNKGTVILLCVALGFVLLAVIILILVGLYKLQDNGKGDARQDRDRDKETSEEYTEESQESNPRDDDHGVVENEGNPAYGYTYQYSSSDETAVNWSEEGQDDSLPYYSGPYNALRNDLSYEISFANESYYALDTGVQILISIEYPQIVSEDIPYVDRINADLRQEYEFYYETFEDSFKPLVRSTEDTYYVVIDSYVTYMDEDILSIVYKESVYLSLQNDPFQDLSFYCINIDLHTGEMMENTEILHVDEAFVATLRDRELIENESRVLGDFSDEEIIEMLMDEGYLVLFYTPMGMEVGLNLGERVIYFMYDDYQQFLNTF